MSSDRSSDRSSSWTPDRGLPEDASPLGRTAARVRRHVSWARHEGVGRVVEEDQLDPRDRIGAALRSARWVRAHGVTPGTARPVLVVGVQRSGTNMVVRGIESAPSVKVYNENSRRAFDRFQLKDTSVVLDLVARDRHEAVLFKALCDSHRTADLLDAFTGPTPARALWVYRSVDDRVRSAVSKFGDVNRRVLAEIAAGRGAGRWQAQRLSPESLELVARVRPDRLDAESGAALFWLVRNRLYFELGLDARPDVHLVGYEQVVQAPEPTIEVAARFLGLAFDPAMAAHVDQRSHRTRRPLDLHPEVRRACDELEERLGAAAHAGRASHTSE